MELEDSDIDYEKKIDTLEDELRRKEERIQELKDKNKVLFETAVQHADTEVDTRLSAEERNI